MRIIIAYSNERSYSCDVCEKAFVLKCDIQVHFKRLHSELRPFTSRYDDCRKIFAIQKNLKHHKIIHTEERP